MHDAMSGHCGSSSLGIVPSTFMIEIIRLQTSTFSLRHRVVGDFVCRWLLYAPPFKHCPHRPGLYAWDRGRKLLFIDDLPNAEDANCIG